MKPQFHVYGLFGPDQLCRYVGLTTRPQARERWHRNAINAPYRAGVFRIIETVDSPDLGARKECSQIADMLASGHPLLNRNAGGSIGFKSTPSFMCVETGELFYSADDLARHLGCVTGTVSHRFKRQGGRFICEMVADYTNDAHECVHYQMLRRGDSTEPVLNYEI